MSTGVSTNVPLFEHSPHSQEKVLSALVNRLKSKLPCNSGLPLSVVEADHAFKKAVESLILLARTHLDQITGALSEYLEKLHQATEEHPNDLSFYHSQLLVARVLSAAMGYRWECAKEGATELGYPPSLPMPFLSPLRHNGFGDSGRGSWFKPPPLDENVAKYTISVMDLYVKQTNDWGDRLKSSGHIHSDTFYNSFGGVEEHAPSTSFPSVPSASPTSHNQEAIHRDTVPSPPPLGLSSAAATTRKLLRINAPLLDSSAASVNALLSNHVHQILFHVSASNWDIIFSRIRLQIRHFATGVDGPDLTNAFDLKLLRHCALDRTRLVQVLQDISSLLISMKRDARVRVIFVLRSAIWNWITIFSGQFIGAMVVQRRLEGAPEQMFDTLFRVINEMQTDQRRLLWPTLAALLVTSPQRLREAKLGLQSKGNKGNSCLAIISQMMMSQTPKDSDVAMVFYLDLCKAAIYVPPTITNSSLRMLAPEMADELKHHIMDSPHEFWASQDPIDVSLYADLIVAIWRFDNPGAVRDVFPICLALERSDAVKATAVRALVTIVSESKQFEHQPPIEPLYQQVGPQLREVYQGLLTSLRTGYPRFQSRQITPTAKKYGNDYFSDPELLVLTLFTLFRLDTNFYFLATESTTDANYIREASILLSPHVGPAIHVSFARTFHSIASSALEVTDADRYLHRNLNGVPERFSGRVVACLSACSSAIMHSRDNYEQLRLHVSMVTMVLHHIFTNPDSPVWKCSDEYRIQGQLLGMVSLIATLPCGQMDISQMAVMGLKAVASSENFEHEPLNGFYKSKEERQALYSTFEQLGDSGVASVGEVAHQNRVRRLIRSCANPTVVHAAAWAECFRHWEALNKRRNNPNNGGGDGAREGNIVSSLSDDDWAEWQNTMLFLSSLGGSCILGGALTPHSLSRWCQPEFLPSELKTPILPVTRFIVTAVDMLTNKYILIRETAKQALGSELHSKLHPLLLSQLDTVTSRLFEGSAPVDWTEHYLTIFADQVTSVLKLLFDRLEPEPASEATHVAPDISHILLLLVRFLYKSPINSMSTRIKTKLCALCDSAFSRADVFILEKSTQQRNTLLDSIVQWVGVPPPHDLPIMEQDEFKRLQNELDAACTKAATVLLDQLRLQPLDGSTGTDLGAATSRLFVKYLQFFVNAMERTSLFDLRDDSISIENRDSNPLTKEQCQIRELAITGISRMLRSNMDSGLRHCLVRGYSDNLRMRCTFILILSKVTRQKPRFDRIEISTALPTRSQLREVVRGDTRLALAIMEKITVSEADVMLPVIINIFDTKLSLLALLKAGIDKEITQSGSYAELFRENTVRTRFVTTVHKVYGYNYLRQILGPLVQGALELPSEIFSVLDPQKTTMALVETIQPLARAFLEVLIDSVQSLPMICREIAAHISERVSQKWPDHRYTAIGGILFLRFICPAITSPETVDISIPPSNWGVRRALLLIAQILQNLANNVLFWKERHLFVLNEFLEQNIMTMTHFLTNVVQLQEDEDKTEEFLGSSYDEADSIVLHRFLSEAADKVGKELLSSSRQSPDAETSAQSGKRTWDNLCSTLVEMGQPLVIPPPQSLASNEHPAYLEFMRRNDHRNIDSMRGLFYLIPTPRNSRPVYVLTLARINVETIELDLLITHIFRTITAEERNFDVIIDCTGFTTTSEIPPLWFKIFLELLPVDLVERFSRCFILNPNHAAAKFLRKLYHICGGTGHPLAKNTYAVSSVEDLKANHLNEVPTDTLPAVSLDKEQCEIYDHVLQKSSNGMNLPISLRICTTHLQILSRRFQNIWPELPCLLNEIILLSEIGDVYSVSTGQDINEFIIKKSPGGTLWFSSADRDLIVHGIRIAKGRLRDDNPPVIESTYTSNGALASLLNIGLLNLSSEEETLRTAAYDLVCAVASSLECDNKRVVPGNGGFVPASSAAFALHTSQKLAIHAPQLTLEMVTEFALGYHRSNPSQKMHCLYYLQPWIKNLDQLSPHFDQSGSTLQNAIRILIELLTKDQDLASMVQMTIWTKIAELDTGIITIALDGLVHAATDGGIGSRRCEIVADTLMVLSSVSVRGKILSRLRKAIWKMRHQPAKNLTENAAWNEVAAITRMALYAGYNTKILVENQPFVPETVHLITLLAATGTTLMRSTVHGIAVNLIQSLHDSCADDPVADHRLHQLLEEVQSPAVLLMFGLVSNGPIGDHSIVERPQDTVAVDTLEALVRFLLRVIGAGAQTSADLNLINVWQARWMSLAVSTVFQSSYIGSRAFVVVGVLGTSDVDDDLLYQILIAFKAALADSVDTNDSELVNMLRCMTKVVPAAPRHSRYLPQIVWLAITLLQCGELTFFAEAARLLQASLETLDHQGVFDDTPITNILFHARSPMEVVTQQVDQLLNLSFETNFSIALASIIFCGMRHPPTVDASSSLLHTLLRLTARPQRTRVTDSGPTLRPVPPDALGFFLSLLATTPTRTAYWKLLQESGAGPEWLPVSGTAEDECVPRVALGLLGDQDRQTAVLITSFLGSMLNSAGAEPEREILFNLIADISTVYPDVVAMIYEGIQDRVVDALTNVSSPTILHAVGIIFRMSTLGPIRDPDIGRKDYSTSTSGGDEVEHGPGRAHLLALEGMQMKGILMPHVLIPRAVGTKMSHWIVELVSRITE